MFRMSGLAPGLYEILAFGSGGTGRPGTSSPSQGSRLVRVQAGQQVSTRIPFLRDATLSGRVFGESGAPLPGVPVVALPEDVRVPVAQRVSASTDDRGVFTLFVAPGRYRLAATPPPLSSPEAILAPPVEGRLAVYPRTFHPRGDGRSAAPLIDAGPGARLSGLDIYLTPVPAFSVIGRLSQLPKTKGLPLVWLRRTPDGSDDEDPAAAQAGFHSPQFVMAGIPAGQYLLQASITPQMPSISHGVAPLRTLPPEPTLWAEVPVRIADRDVAIDVTLREGYRLGGRVVFEGGTPPPIEELQGWALLIEGADAPDRGLRGVYVSPASFTSVQLTPGRSFLRPFMAEGWYLKSVTAGGRPATDAVIDIRDGDRQDVTITFSDRAATVEGTIELDAGPEPERPMVYIFPAERDLWQHIGAEPARIAKLLTGATGKFTTTMPPGTYYVAATGTPVQLPADLAALSASAELISLVEGTTVIARRIRAVRLR
jgi:hypothetical protein